MNERVMQFRLGMFVIGAGLVLTMLIVWFGESPSLLRDSSYVTVRFTDAPGVSEGIPVRKSGIRIGEVESVAFDERPGQPDGVLVTLSIERKYKIRAGSTPRINKALVGDVSIDMSPGAGPGLLKTSSDRRNAPIIEGEVALDPAKALLSATAALDSFKKAADGISAVTQKVGGIDELLTTWKGTGEKLGAASESFDRLVKANEGDFKPALASLRQFAENANNTFDAQTQSQLKTGIDRFSTAAAKLDSGLADLQPFVKDLGAGVDAKPTTNFGWGLLRFNRIMYDVGLLTQTLEDKDKPGRLNPNGSFQRMVTRPELYENINSMAVNASKFFEKGKDVMANFNKFAERVARDPSALTRGALSPR